MTESSSEIQSRQGRLHAWLQRADRWHLPITLAVLAAALLPGLGRMGLLDPWEMDRAAVARRMASLPRVVVAEEPGDQLLNQIEKLAPDRYALVRAAAKSDAMALASLQQANTRLGREVAHALVVDADAVRKQLAGNWAEVANQVAAAEAQNRGMALVLVSETDAAGLAKALQQARARQFGQAHRNAATAGWIDGDNDAAGMWPLLGGDEQIVAKAKVANALAASVPSPWRWPVHKRDNQNTAVPWLDAAATAAGLKIGGPTEFGARLGEALLMLLCGLFAALGARRLFGAAAGWAALGVFATLPEALGIGRVLSFEAGPALGATLLALGLAQGAARDARLRSWPLWVAAGALVLLGAKGLGGATMAAATAVAYVLMAGDFRPAMAAAALGTLALLGAAAWMVLGDGDPSGNWQWVLRGWRFTQGSFSAGPDQYHRDFAWFVGQAGFGVFPWGAAVVLGAARLLDGDRDDQDRRFAVGAALVCSLVVPFAVAAVLIRQFHHLVAPLAGVAAVVAAVLVAEALRGKLSGRMVAAFVALSTLLLHREIGKGGDAVTRFVAFDPPIIAAGGTGEPAWPTELVVNKGLHALALLAVLAFAVGTARPMATVRQAVALLQGRAAAAWALGGIGLIWAIDALVSLGTKLDVLLKTQAQTNNYAYDRLWVVIQDTRPEVLAAAFAFGALLVLALLATRGQLLGRWGQRFLKLAAPFGSPLVANIALGAGALAVLGTGISIFGQLQPESGIGGAISAGLGSAAFCTPAALLACSGVALTVLKRTSGTDSLWAPLVEGTRDHTALVFSALGWWMLAGVGVGASQAAGTWSFPVYLAGMWWLALASLLVVAGKAGARAQGYGWPTAAMGLYAMWVLFGPLAGRWVAESATPSEGYAYLAKALVAAPDTAVLWAAAALIAANRWAAGSPAWQPRFDTALGWLGRIERPHYAAGALFVGALCFATGYAWSLLPGMAVHFSQKHLIQRIAEAGGAGNDDHGAPRTFSHGGARAGNDNNFYTQSMPLIDDRQSVLAVLANENIALRITEGGQGGTTRTVALPGWNKALDGDGNLQRDDAAWFGLVASTDNAKVKVGKQGWQAGQWKGAAVFAPQGQTATVVDNSEDELTLSVPLQLQADDAVRGWVAMDKAAAGKFGAVKPEQFSAMAPVQRFVVLPKDSFSELNHAMRTGHGGEHIAVMDSSSSRLVLAANFLRAAQPDQNWLRKAMIKPEDLNSIKGFHKILVNFDNSIHLVGYKLADQSVQRSQKYRMTLYWKVVKPTATNWKLFMHPHPLHLDRWPLTQPDPSEDENKPCNGCFQTNHWLAGDLIADEFEQEVPLGTNSGPNEIILGWYNPSNDQRMPVISATGAGVIKHGDNRATIGHLQIR